MNAADLAGCFDLSNPITVTRDTSGQVCEGEPVVYRAHLSGLNEVLPVPTLAFGDITATLNGNTLTVSGSFFRLSSALNVDLRGGLHIHSGLAGQNGPIVFELNAETADGGTSGTLEEADNIFELTDEQVVELENRGLYVNVHSLDFPSGEIRAQLLPESDEIFGANLLGSFEVPAVVTQAFGAAVIELNGNEMTVSGSFSNLEGDFAADVQGGAHIHLAMAGQNGGIEFPLTTSVSEDLRSGTFNAADNVFPLTDEQVANLQNRRYYFNIHSEKQRSGEIRGQIIGGETRAAFYAILSGSSEVALVNTAASGAVIVEVLTGSRVSSSGSFSDLESDLATDIMGGAHIHEGLAGQNGGIALALNSSTDDNRSGAFPFADNQADVATEVVTAMFERSTYVNVHSQDNRPGEIRGQLLPFTPIFLTTTLLSFNEVPPARTTGNGALIFELAGNLLRLSGAFSDLEGDFDATVAGGSHIHLAAVGTNGGIEIQLSPNLDDDLKGGIYSATDTVYELSDEQLEGLIAGNNYVNIHTTTLRPGEIRGQILPEPNDFPAGTLMITSPADGAAVTIEGNGDTPFEAMWEAGTDRDPLAYVWQLSAAEDFSAILFETVVSGTTFSTDFATVDGLLADAGVAVGDTVTLYHRAVATDGALSTPGTGASVIITRGEIGGQLEGVDLELTITADNEYTIYEVINYTLTLRNNGTDTATNIVVAAGLPEGLVFSGSETSKGSYSLFFERWTIDALASGETATLNLRLFPLIGAVPITNFVEVTAIDQPDADSTPGNGNAPTPAEDDEAVVTVQPDFVPPMGGAVSDLELFLETDREAYEIYTDFTYIVTLVNNGPDTAANIIVSAAFPEGMVHSRNEATHGRFGVFFQQWEIDLLPAGDTATLRLTLFPLVENVTIVNFMEVVEVDQDDPDSTPANGAGQTPREDDEAVIKNQSAPPGLVFDGDGQAIADRKALQVSKVYPVPADNQITVEVNSTNDQSVVVRVVDLSGKQVQRFNTDLYKGFNEMQLNTTTFSPGKYYILIDTTVLPFVIARN